ncbi:MAG: magnesium/cobalt transporter CorA [Myxococcota bacterium]
MRVLTATLAAQETSFMHFQKRTPPRGARPGTLVPGEHALPPRLRLITYDRDSFEERSIERIADIDVHTADERLYWLDVQGLGDEALIRELGERFRMHPLALEDVVNAPQRPKADSYEHNHLTILREFTLVDMPQLMEEQVSVLLGPRYVVTFQEHYGDKYDTVRERLRNHHSSLRLHGADYLAYALIDATVDGCHPVLEALSEHLDELDEEVLLRPTPNTLEALAATKRSLTKLRRVLGPQRDAILRLTREESPLLTPAVQVFFRDVFDHAQQANEVVESFREVAANQMNTYLSVVSNRTNDIMRILTIISTVFIPLTFLTGLYGMNFRFMPELEYRYSYPLLILFMGALSIVQLIFFFKRRWIGRSRRYR